jgi:GT2 family glycosyltransferase/predicted O-methyltransferase YrrM
MINVSIVIPTMNLSLTKKCIESIIKYTNLDDKEIIIVANGADPEIKNYIGDLKNNNIPISYKWFDEPLGAVIALNEGIKISGGEFVLLLNDDCEILESNKDYWVSSLIEPFSDPMIGCTGPFRMNNTLGTNILNLSKADLEYGFIIFFCALIRRSLFDKIGLLDEGLKCGVDIDFCLKLKRNGYKIKQIPHNDSLKDVGQQFCVGSYPIWHQAEATVHDYYGLENWNKIIKNDQRVLEERYSINKIEKNNKNIIDITWPASQKKYELVMIQEFLKNYKTEKILEIGTYKGGSALLWAQMVAPYNGKVFCCDLNFESDGFYYTDENNKIYNYRRQVYNDTEYEKYVIEFPGDSHDINYINNVKNNVGIVDLLFIDGDHSYTGVKQDFENFYSLVKDDGYIIFHDIQDTKIHRDSGCEVSDFWNDIKNLYPSWEFIDQNDYITAPSKSMGIGIIQKNSKEVKRYKTNNSSKSSKKSNVLCNICTKNRYDSTLSLAIQSIITQTVKPDHLIIYDDNIDSERIDLRENETYNYLFGMLDYYNIKWEVSFGLQKGQHYGHQFANKKGFQYVWRLDDDEIACPDTLEKLLYHMKEDVGAVGGAILTKGYSGEGSGKLEDIYSKPNLQWCNGNKICEVDHLHSSFLYRAGIVDYCLDLSPVAHREETLFSHELKEKGYKLIVDQSIITHHLKQQSTGIRSHNSEWFYKHDEKIFSKKMEEWGYKLITLDNGLGDHLSFLNILPDLKKKWKHLILGVCYPYVFKDHPDVTLISVSQSNPINDDNIYKWMIDNNWKSTIGEAFRTCYDVKEPKE